LEAQTLSAQQAQLESWIEEQTIHNTTIVLFSKKTAWLIGLILGTVSGAIIMIVSYWSVQIVSPVPRMENLQLQQPRLSR
jgi:serine/threonine-protein kinase